MKSLIVLSYVQPYTSERNLYFGILEKERDTVTHPVGRSDYRWNDKDFKRSRTLATITTFRGVRQLYLERTSWKIKIPFVGSLLRPFISKG